MRYVDAHVHVMLGADAGAGAALAAAALADELAAADLGLFSCGLTPRAWEADRAAWDGCDRVRVGAGLHPWAVGSAGRLGFACGDAEAALLEELCWRTRYVGEVGLDFGRKTSAEAAELQLAFFRRACAAAATASRETGVARVLSIHAVRAADVATDVLESTGALDACACVFHWFSGSNAELRRAMAAGCWFSLNEHGLASGKGREYAKLVPADRLLTETDAEPHVARAEQAGEVVGSLEASLERAVSTIAEARGADADELCALVAANGVRLLFG